MRIRWLREVIVRRTAYQKDRLFAADSGGRSNSVDGR